MSPTPVGAQGHLGLVKETSFGAGGTPSKWQSITSESVNRALANIYSDKIQNSSEQVYGSTGVETVAGDIVFPVTPRTAEEWFECALGQASSPHYVERPIEHLSFEIDHETAAVEVSGCAIGSLVIGSTQGEELIATVSIEAKGMSTKTAGTPVYSGDDAPYLHTEATFRLNDVADTSITTWSLTLENTLVTDLFGAGTQRLDIPAGKLAVTGTFTKLFDDTTERNAFLNAGERKFWVKFARGSNYLTIYCPKVKYNAHTENLTGQSDYILETFDFTAFTNDPSSDNSVRISGDFS